MSKFKWVVEIEVDEMWVEDGFDLDDERANEMIRRELPYATGIEVGAKVLEAPDKKVIRKIQGYAD